VEKVDGEQEKPMQILIYISIGVVIGYFGFKAVKGENKDKNSFSHSAECENVPTQVQEKQNPNPSEMDGQSREEKKDDINEKILGLVKKAQIDIVDGKYAPVKTWPFAEKYSDDLMKLARGDEKFPYINDFILEIDMMVLHPIEYINDFISLGAKSFVIHIDSTDHIKECIDTIKNSECAIGLGIKPSVDVDLLQPFLPLVDFVQFMGNDKVGHSGMELDKSVVNKIKYFHEKHSSVPIQIDIGVSEETIPKLKSAGVSSFISGSSIFNSPNIKEAITKLQSF